MNKNNSFVLYADSKNLIDLLTDEQAGRLIKGIFDFVESGTIPQLDDVTKVVFTAIQNYIVRDKKKYEEICRKRAEIGKLGGAPKGNQNASKQAKQPIATKTTKSKQNNQLLPKQPDNDNENDNVNDNESENESVNESESESRTPHTPFEFDAIIRACEESTHKKIDEISRGIAHKEYLYKPPTNENECKELVRRFIAKHF